MTPSRSVVVFWFSGKHAAPLIFFHLVFVLSSAPFESAVQRGMLANIYPTTIGGSQIRFEALIQNMCVNWEGDSHAAETVSAHPDIDLNQNTNIGATLLDSMFSARVMFPPNETLEIPLWKNSSCGRMKDVFGLQCHFFRLCAYGDENTRLWGT